MTNNNVKITLKCFVVEGLFYKVFASINDILKRKNGKKR